MLVQAAEQPLLFALFSFGHSMSKAGLAQLDSKRFFCNHHDGEKLTFSLRENLSPSSSANLGHSCMDFIIQAKQMCSPIQEMRLIIKVRWNNTSADLHSEIKMFFSQALRNRLCFGTAERKRLSLTRCQLTANYCNSNNYCCTLC